MHLNYFFLYLMENLALYIIYILKTKSTELHNSSNGKSNVVNGGTKIKRL